MPVESRKVFISWSKAPTDRVATELAQLLKHMFDNVSPFVSKDNVAFGSLSIGEIHRQLAGTSFGILIVTRANQSEPWLNFEAGSLAKTIPDDSDARVVPLLIDHESIAQLAGPIANLQAVLADREGVRRLLSEMADTLGVDAAVFESRWPTGWDRFHTALTEARQELAEGPTPPERTPDEMLEEIVTLLRARPASATPSATVRSTAEERDAVDLVWRLASQHEVDVESIRLPQTQHEPPILGLWLPPDSKPEAGRLNALQRRLQKRFPDLTVEFQRDEN